MYTSMNFSSPLIVKTDTLKSPNPVVPKDQIGAAFFATTHLFNTLDLNPPF